MGKQIAKYVNQIRNDRKRAYALAYAEHVLNDAAAPESNGLSVMAAQAVHMNINDLAKTA